MSNSSQTETDESKRSRKSQRQADPSAARADQPKIVDKQTDQTFPKTANGGAHPVHVKNR